jgi:uncharacterized protein YndB with AHSA1/START domain
MADVEVSVHIDAPAERVWELVGDPARMGEWSPETTKVVYRGGAAGPALGARFRGYNKVGVKLWWTSGRITTYEPGRHLVWDVTSTGLPVAAWGYRVDPDADGRGCTVTETFDDHRGGIMKVLGMVVRTVGDAHEHNRKGMEATLAKVKAAAEAG